MADSVLSSVIRLTRERDTDDLARSVIDTIVELTGATSVVMYWNEGQVEGQVERGFVLEVSDAEPREKRWILEPELCEPDEAQRECWQEGRLVEVVSPEGARLLLPVISAASQLAILEVRSRAVLAPSDRSLIQGFLTVYGNYLALLDEGARDKLTGLFNRRTFDDKLSRLLRVQEDRHRMRIDPHTGERREVAPDARAWLAILDLDHFKRINDSFGHAYGDEVLLTVARKLQAGFRKTDLLFRFGGEEFVIVLEPAPAHMALLAFERFRESLAQHEFHALGQVTASLGFAGIAPCDYPPTVLERADKALYYAKDHGRNCTFQYEALVERGELCESRASGSIDLF